MCNEPMPYRKIEGPMKMWAPSDYAWFCPGNCGVIRHDGSIDPNEDTWEKRKAKEDRKDLNSYLSSLYRKMDK